VDLSELVDPIATRRFEWRDDGGARHVVEVALGRPVRVDGSGEMRCPFRILGFGSEEVRYAVGVDGVQAILLSLRMIRANLEALEFECSARLSWSGSDPGDLGL
jgi:hypothetical protein